ncbi:hypothetical protein ACOMHN_040000 [Nucella lapillus]
MRMIVLVLFLLSTFLHSSDGCVFPGDLSGVWRSSRWGDVTFSSNILTVTGITIGTVTFECETLTGSIYILRSTTTVSVLNNVVDVVTCLDLRQLTSTKFYYYHSTSEVPFISGVTEPVKLVSPSSNVNVTTACDVTAPYTAGTNHVLIKSGSESDAAVQCPDPLLANFNNYTIDKGSGAQCGGVGYINVCDDRKNIYMDYSVCSETVFYSSGGNLACVYTSSSGSTYYVNVYNSDSSVDGSNTFRFSCIVGSYGTYLRYLLGKLGKSENLKSAQAMMYGSDGYVYATQYPQTCADAQTATSVPSSPYTGGTLQLAANVPSTADDGVNVGGIVAAVIIMLLIAVVVGLAIYHLGYRKRWPLVRQKLPCFKGQVDPQPTGAEGEVVGEEEEDAKPGATSTTPLAGVNVVTTAVVSQQDTNQKKPIKSSRSSRSVVSPSKLHADLSEDHQLNSTPRRLPPLNPVDLPEGSFVTNPSPYHVITQFFDPFSDPLNISRSFSVYYHPGVVQLFQRNKGQGSHTSYETFHLLELSVRHS